MLLHEGVTEAELPLRFKLSLNQQTNTFQNDPIPWWRIILQVDHNHLIVWPNSIFVVVKEDNIWLPVPTGLSWQHNYWERTEVHEPRQGKAAMEMCPGETKGLFPSPAQGPVQMDLSPLLLQD